jgi:hypothetical protein
MHRLKFVTHAPPWASVAAIGPAAGCASSSSKARNSRLGVFLISIYPEIRNSIMINIHNCGYPSFHETLAKIE